MLGLLSFTPAAPPPQADNTEEANPVSPALAVCAECSPVFSGKALGERVSSTAVAIVSPRENILVFI